MFFHWLCFFRRGRRDFLKKVLIFLKFAEGYNGDMGTANKGGAPMKKHTEGYSANWLSRLLGREKVYVVEVETSHHKDEEYYQSLQVEEDDIDSAVTRRVREQGYMYFPRAS